ncbi:hypothetical protein EOPP23_13040 [Endozoicomonas sp. OPT23]|uniref:flagellar basal body-associated FliL family protein n=1 Tax=Endozoicomonas sp. OPT23 TaxID=2072845 RepID=UPI00129B235C|nr:flagellar basal body-associated FliL family protein [Endozoicomonas sp. OPT23]MRI33914.1 hypothetical protein [Endozoicomonas sp. OPT23]
MSFSLFKRSQNILALAILLVIGLVFGLKVDQAKASEEDLLTSYYLQLDPLILNVKSPRRRGAYLKVTPVLVSTDESFHSKLENNIPLVRNTFLELYSNKNVDQLLAEHAMEEMRQLSLTTLRDLLKKQDGIESLSDVLFMEFVVQ